MEFQSRKTYSLRKGAKLKGLQLSPATLHHFSTASKTDSQEKDPSIHIPGDPSPTESSTTGPPPSVPVGLQGQGVVQKLFSYRWLMVLLLHGSMVVNCVQRDCMSMVIVCMFDEDPLTSLALPSNSSSPTNVGFNASNAYIDEAEDTTRPTWDSNTRGLVISAATFTSFLSPILGEFLRKKMGNKMAMTFVHGTSCVLTFVSPTVARTSPYLMMAVRCVLGVFYSANIPCLTDCTAWWAPSSEILAMTTFIFVGLNTSGILLFFTAGYICTIPVDDGWPFIFYTYGIVATIWLVLWILLGSHKPEDHPLISEEEKAYIMKSRRNQEDGTQNKGKTPYWTILKSRPVLVLVYCASCHLWGTTLLLSFAPIYVSDFLRFSVQDTGVVLSVLTVLRLCAALTWMAVGSWMVSKMSVTSSRKKAVFIGYFPSGLALVGMAFLQDYSAMAVCVMLMAVFALQACGICHLSVLPLDLAPRYAGFIAACWVCVATLVSMSAPLLATFLTSEGTSGEWQRVWFIASAIFLSTAIVFLVFGEAKVQPWAKEDNADQSVHTQASSVDLNGKENSDLSTIKDESLCTVRDESLCTVRDESLCTIRDESLWDLKRNLASQKDGIDNRILASQKDGIDNPIMASQKDGIDNPIMASQKDGIDNPIMASQKDGIDNPRFEYDYPEYDVQKTIED